MKRAISVFLDFLAPRKCYSLLKNCSKRWEETKPRCMLGMLSMHGMRGMPGMRGMHSMHGMQSMHGMKRMF